MSLEDKLTVVDSDQGRQGWGALNNVWPFRGIFGASLWSIKGGSATAPLGPSPGSTTGIVPKSTVFGNVSFVFFD